MKIDIEVVKVGAARKQHTCGYCNGKIAKGQSYNKLLSRLETERFPVAIEVCSSHQIGLVPLSLLLKRGQDAKH